MNSFKPRLFETFTEIAAKTPDAIVIRHEDVAYSYHDLHRHLRRAELYILEHLIRQEDSAEAPIYVCFWGENHPIALLLPLVCSKLGLTYVPISPLCPKERVAEIVRSLNGILIGQEVFEVSEREAALHEARISELQAARKTDQSRQKYLLGFYTSGTSGLPKLALIPEEQVIENVQAAIQVQGLSQTDRIFAGLSLCHSGGLGIQALPGLLSGARINLKTKVSPETLADPSDDSNVLLLVPSVLQKLKLSRHETNVKWSRFRLVGIGSAPFAIGLVDPIIEAGAEVMNIYGLTEAGPVLFTKSLTKGVPPSIGYPSTGLEWKIEAATDELLVRGKIVQAAYLSGNAIEHVHDSGGWFNTRDRFALRQNQLYFLGRTTATFNVGGMKVHAEKVEAAIEELPGVQGCLINIRTHRVFGEILVAHVEISGASPSKRNLLRNLRQRHPDLSRYEIPREVEFVENLPRTTIGKKMRGRAP